MTSNRCPEHKYFNCKDCNVCTTCTDEYYMVTDEIWNEANNFQRNGMLCIGCLEARLGRQLTNEDFPNYPINRGFFPMSARFLDRLAS